MKDKPLSKEELKEIMDEILERNGSVPNNSKHCRYWICTSCPLSQNFRFVFRKAHQNSNADNGFDIIIQRDEQK